MAHESWGQAVIRGVQNGATQRHEAFPGGTASTWASSAWWRVPCGTWARRSEGSRGNSHYVALCESEESAGSPWGQPTNWSAMFAWKSRLPQATCLQGWQTRIQSSINESERISLLWRTPTKKCLDITTQFTICVPVPSEKSADVTKKWSRMAKEKRKHHFVDSRSMWENEEKEGEVERWAMTSSWSCRWCKRMISVPWTVTLYSADFRSRSDFLVTLSVMMAVAPWRVALGTLLKYRESLGPVSKYRQTLTSRASAFLMFFPFQRFKGKLLFNCRQCLVFLGPLHMSLRIALSQNSARKKSNPITRWWLSSCVMTSKEKGTATLDGISPYVCFNYRRWGCISETVKSATLVPGVRGLVFRHAR